MIKDVPVVNIMVFWEKGKDKGEGNKKGLRLKNHHLGSSITGLKIEG